MSEKENSYCNNIYAYSRLKTKVVNIGNIPMGGNYPIRIQSMTNTNTLDTNATVEQSIRMINAGCEYVRITAPGIKEAENLLKIKNCLKQKGYQVPLIADIHFNPKAAEIAATIVEKVRINPGNYIDRKSLSKFNYTEKEYTEEEFMALYEQFGDFDDLQDQFIIQEEEFTTLVASYVDEHLDQFITIEK